MFFKEFTNISTPSLPILFLAKSNLDIRLVSISNKDITLIELRPRQHWHNSTIRFLHFALQNSLNFKNDSCLLVNSF